jgi:hypothetical protein
MGKMTNACKIFVRKPEAQYHTEDLAEDGRIILEWILGKQVGRCELDSTQEGD